MGWSRLRNLDLMPVLATVLIGAWMSVLFAQLDIERRASEERERVVGELAAVRARLEGVLKATFSSTDGLVHLVSIQGGIAPDLFAGMARLAIGKNAVIRNITLAPDDTVAYVYPFAGNEKVIGFRYESRPEQWRTVNAARERGGPVLAGPVDLVQGGRGLINRAPIFVPLDDGRGGLRYWGTASIVAYVDRILEEGDFRAAAGIGIALRGKDGRGADGDLIDGDGAIFAAQPVLMDVQVPGGTWQLAAIPRGGWRSTTALRSQYFHFGLAISLLLGFIVFLRGANIRQVQLKSEALQAEMKERRKAEAALIEEERRFRLLFESSPDPAWIIKDNCFVECNAAAARVLGYADGEGLMFVHPSKLSPEIQPDGESSYAKAERMMDLVKRNGVHRFEWIHTRSDGSVFPAEVTLSTLVLQGSEAIYCIWRDISERKKAEEELRASQSLLQAIVDSAGAVIYAFDTEGCLLICNHQFESVVGCRREEALGKTRHEFMPAAVADEHRGNDLAVIGARRRTSFEEHNQEADGIHHYLTVKGPILGADGQVRGVVGISTDISDRKRNEERLKLAAAVFDSTADGVIVTDRNADIVSVNRAFTEITGYTEDEVRGHNCRLFKSERQGPEFYQAMWKSLKEADVWRGEIWNRRKNGELYPEWLTISAIRGDGGTVSHYVAVFSDISTIKRSQEELERLAHFDPLTGLPNRVLFQDRLTHAIDRADRYGHGIAVLLMDLDGFKTVNDSLGHPAGDRLLQEVARRLKDCIRVEDTVARLGGDEFALILASLRDGADAVEVVRKLLTTVEAPFDLEGMGALVTASIGLAVYPADGASATELVRNADAAMYGAKEGGRNTYRFYQATMTHRAQERLHRETALRRGIDRREFEVWFQPQLSLHSGRLTGAEALVRWRDPQHGLVPPVEFIPLAERTGLIVPLGEQVLDQVCAFGRQWLEEGLPFGRLAVNVAVPQIERGDFVATVRTALQRHDLAPGHLEIEVTESFIMESAARAREVLQRIQALGVTISVDDFGTGYSSLAYLKTLPIDNLKIDRTFVKDLPGDANDVAIARAVISLGHSLGFKVIAEGIETDEQREFLRREGCDEMQGYLIGRPMPAAEFAAWLRRCIAADR